MFAMLKINVLPVSIGVLFNYLFGRGLALIIRVSPSISVLVIFPIIAIIVASNQTSLHSVAGIVMVTVVLLNLIGFCTAYFVSYWLGYKPSTRNIVAIEISMQHSGLAVALATEYFKSLATLPGAVFSIWHNLSGFLLAAIWPRQVNKDWFYCEVIS